MKIFHKALFLAFFLVLYPLSCHALSTLRVCLPDDNIPYSFMDDEGIRHGFDLDIMKAMELPYDIEFVPEDYATALAMLDNGSCHMLLSSRMITPALKKRFLLSYPHLQSNLHALVLDQSHLKDNDGLQYSLVGVIKGSSAEKYAFKKLINSTIIALTQKNILVSLLLQGEIEALIGDKTFLLLVQNSHKHLQMLEPYLEEQNFGYIFSKKNEALQQEVSNAVKKLEDEGILAEIYSQWFEPQQQETPTE